MTRADLHRLVGCDTDRVLDLIAGQAELLGDHIDRFARAEQVDHVIGRGTADGERGRPKPWSGSTVTWARRYCGSLINWA